MKAGFIAVVGRPNVGKSTLINKLVSEKVAIVSDKSGTTRDNIKGILNFKDNQYIFIDTPGIHKPQHLLGEYMTNIAVKILKDVDIILFLIDASKPIGTGDMFVMDRINENAKKKPKILLVNKVDLISDEQKEEKIKELNEELEIMVRNHAKLEEVEDAGYKAQLDDTVDLAFEGFMDGVPFPGGKAESHLLKLGSKSFIDNFEEQLVGYTKGQEGEITVKFPAEYHAAELAGKPAQFKVKINAIKKLKQPELNDEFAKELGYASLDELKAKTKEETIKRENDRIENEYVSALLDKLLETTTIDVPVSMVQAEIQNRLKELEYQLSMQGFKMDDYLKMMGGNVETFAAQLAPAAEKKVKIDLILDKIAKENNFEATDEELSQRMEEVAKMYGMDVPALEEELKKNKNLENFKASLKYDIVMKKAIDEVVKNSKNA